MNETLQPYAYASDNSISNSDPTGTRPTCAANPGNPSACITFAKPFKGGRPCNSFNCSYTFLPPVGGGDAPDKSWSQKAKNPTLWVKWLKTFFARGGRFERLSSYSDKAGKVVWIDVEDVEGHFFESHIFKSFTASRKNVLGIQKILSAANDVEGGVKYEWLERAASDGWRVKALGQTIFLSRSASLSQKVKP